VLEAMTPYFGPVGYNPSSLHAEGRQARAALDDARDRVAAALGAARKEIVFTGSGSEADTLAIAGLAHAAPERRHLVTSAIEHHAVLNTLAALEEAGYEITRVPVDSRGLIELDAFAASLRPDTLLASVMLANNEIGVIEPVAALAATAHERGILFHADAVQAAPWLPVQPRELGADLLSISAHKCYGPKGVGALYVREGVALAPLIYGGGQEFGLRSGTENVAGVVGLATALEVAQGGVAERAARIGALRDRLEAAVVGHIEEVRVNGAGAPRLPNNLNVSFSGIDSEALLMGLDLEGVAVSAGSACTSGALEPSHVIAALGAAPRWRQGVIRFSLGDTTTAAEIDRVAEILTRLVPRLRGNRVSARKARLA